VVGLVCFVCDWFFGDWFLGIGFFSFFDEYLIL
jgi:hypothetical protein